MAQSLFKLCRSFMYVPGDKTKMLNKIINSASQSAPDIAVFDCEDGVGFNNKHLARKNLLNLFQTGEINRCKNSTICIRINSFNNETIYEEDVMLISECIKASNYSNLHMVNLPKVDNFEDLRRLDHDIQSKIDVNKLKSQLLLSIMIESCMGIVNLVDICRELKNNKLSCFAPGNIVFGSDDYCASLGVKRTRANTEVLFARQVVANTCKAFNIDSIDMVDIDLKDEKLLRTNCEVGVNLGFLGKQVIHPSQLSVVHSAFSPSDERVEWAQGLLTEFESSGMGHTGVFVYQGQMIDMPSIEQARNIVERHEVISRKLD